MAMQRNGDVDVAVHEWIYDDDEAGWLYFMSGGVMMMRVVWCMLWLLRPCSGEDGAS